MKAEIEDALFTWISTVGGIPVIWEGQNSPRPSGAYIALRVRRVITVGRDWVNVVVDGEDVQAKARGQRQVILILKCFGAGDPATMLDQVISSAKLPSHDEALSAVGVSVLSSAPAQSIDGVIGSAIFEPRATAEVTLSLASELSEASTYIQTAVIENQLTGDTLTIPE